ncbi:hypothetical protein VTO42DRAFT_2062 [Malbranchea cinnamomea]
MAADRDPTSASSAIASDNALTPSIDALGENTMDLPHRPKPTEPNGNAASAPDITSNETNDDGDDSPFEEKNVTQELIMMKKKKKKGLKGGRGKKKPTGFEEYYVDAPMTPAEFEEEKKLYDASIPVIRRIELAIQRYQTKRRLNDNRRHVFTKYLSYGGVKVGPKMFGGNDPRDLKDMEGEDIVTATAESNIPEDRSNWLVDFELVAKGFLYGLFSLFPNTVSPQRADNQVLSSSVLPRFFGLETKELVDLATSTIKNFLNYIIYHNVCPEYEASIFAARKICDVANVELWKSQQTNVWLPGDFNMACSTLFGGFYFGLYTGDQDWTDEKVGAAGMPDNAARKVVKFALAGAGTYEQAIRFRDLANKNKLDSKCIDENGFEVIAIAPPSNDIKDFYHAHVQDLKPVGKVRARPWHDPGLPDEDLPPGEIPLYLESDRSVEYEFFVEESILQWLFVGMKVDAKVWQLNCGIYYFDRVVAVYCSFYTVLPNENMLGWKEPRDLRDDAIVMTEGKVEAPSAENDASRKSKDVEEKK